MSETPDLSRAEAHRERPGVSASGGTGSGPGAWPGRLVAALIPSVILVSLLSIDLPLCPSRHLLGLPCPGCGLTRATGAMLEADWASMWAFHPLAPLITPLVGYTLARITLVSAGVLRREAWDPLRKVPTWAWTVLVVTLLGLWFVRLAGGLGGLPDPVDFSEGLLGRLYRSASG